MPDNPRVYTYRAGEKIELEKEQDQFVVRAMPDELHAAGLPPAERVSSHSSRVVTRAPDMERQMSEARHLAPTHHAYRIADTGEEFLITDRIFVSFRDGTTAEQIDAFAGRYSLLLLTRYTDRDYLFQLTDHTGMNPLKLVVMLTEEEPLVASAEHDLNYRAQMAQLQPPTDPSYARQWHLHNRLTNPDVDPRSSSRCEDAWQLLGHFGSADVVVGVTDDGCKLDHPDFNGADKFAGWGYFEGSRLVTSVDIDAEPALMYQPGANHGTSCAGVIAGEADAVLTVGAAPGCRLLPIKWESSGASLFIGDSKLLTALDYLADKVDVVSNSWGIVPTSLTAPFVVQRIRTLAQTGGRRGRGILFLWAAGNENCPIQHTAAVDIPYTNGWSPSGTAWVGVQTARVFRNSLVGVEGVAHVAALASTAQRSHYSNYGTGIVICAPTSNSHRFRRLAVRGLGITTATGSAGSVTNSFGGTSSATPLVAGVAALVISANPELTAVEVLSLLARTAAKDLNESAYARTPPATFDPNPVWDVSPVAPFDSGVFMDTGSPNGTWSPWFGHGRVDARDAVAAARAAAPVGAGQPLRITSSPDKAIPDNTPAGLQDSIEVTAAGRVQDVKVSVDITHTWIGDLRLTLTAPDGTAAVLHNRTGAGRDNIRQTYDATSAPALVLLRNRPITGNWSLHVQDLAGGDRGRLKNWTLELSTGVAPLVGVDEQATHIPDAKPEGITRMITLAGGRTIRDLAVAVDITHPWIGDLKVTLHPPGGPPIVLHDRVGGDGDNIVRTWRSTEVEALRALRGRDAGGDWRLQAADLERRDVGKLNRWSVEVVD